MRYEQAQAMGERFMQFVGPGSGWSYTTRDRAAYNGYGGDHELLLTFGNWTFTTEHGGSFAAVYLGEGALTAHHVPGRFPTIATAALATINHLRCQAAKLAAAAEAALAEPVPVVEHDLSTYFNATFDEFNKD